MASHELRILVPVDFSDTSRRALDEAFAWALRAPTQLHLVHVVDATDGHLAGELVHNFEELARIAEMELAKMVPTGAGHEPIGEIQRHLRSGDPATEILRTAIHQGVDLIIMGTHGRTGVRRLFMGSVAEKVVRRAGCPVLCVKPAASGEPERAPTWRRLLCPVDFSDTSHRALLAAVDLARRLNVELFVLHVYLPPAMTSPDGSVVGTPELIESVATAAEANLAAWRREAQARAGADVKIGAACVLGSPADEIVRFARQQSAGAIVMGTHGRTGLVRVLMGSVAEKVVRTAPCPVLTIHPAQPAGAKESDPEPPVIPLA